MTALIPTRERVTWTRWDAGALRMRTSHPIVWTVTEPDGYERSFDTRREADAWIAENYPENYPEITDGA